MKERPILFSGPMVRALIDGKKTQTRRIVAEQRGWDPQKLPLQIVAEHPDLDHTQAFFGEGWGAPCPYGKRGDRLWVRETWAAGDEQHRGLPWWAPLWYAADATPEQCAMTARWRPSIHMRREFSRLTLEVTGVRVERLGDISTADIWAEGVQIPVSEGRPLLRLTGKHPPGEFIAKLPKEWTADDWARAHFASLWSEINGRESWASNPWVWVIEFKRAEPTPGQTEGGR